MLNPKESKDLESIKKCRSITNEILNYGVSQSEILKIVELLSLELEDIILMKEIISCFKSINTKEEKQQLIL
jgi:hypothetical protein